MLLSMLLKFAIYFNDILTVSIISSESQASASTKSWNFVRMNATNCLLISTGSILLPSWEEMAFRSDYLLTFGFKKMLLNFSEFSVI